MAAPALAGPLRLTVDRVYRDTVFVHVLSRVVNDGPCSIARAEVECDAFDADGKAVGNGSSAVKAIAPGQTVIANVIVSAPDGVDPVKAQCRVVD